MTTLLLFVVLQFCDAFTTLVFLRHGVAEANPVVRFAFTLSATPWLPLIVLKTFACGLAYLAWRTRRLRLLLRANWFFGLCVVWNLAALAVARA
jgi:hypothetical protein